MPVLTVSQLIGYAQQAKFTGQNLINIVSIAMAESGGDTAIINSIGAVGVLQILISAHPDVTIAQAKDPAFSFQYAYKLSNGGKNFCPWQSYSSSICGASGPNGWDNRWAQYVPAVTAAVQLIGTQPGGAGTITLAPGGDVQWVVLRDWGGYGSQCDAANDYPHYARDVHNQPGDVLTSLVPGTVVDLDQSGNHGGGIGTQIFIQPSAYPPSVDASYPVQGIPALQWYCYHFLPGTAVVKVGQVVQPGQKLALCGYYGHSGVYTHTHTGWFDGTYPATCPIGARPHGPDIGPYLSAIKSSRGTNLGLVPGGSQGGTGGSYTGTVAQYVPLLQQVHQTLVDVPGFYGMALALDEAEQFPGFVNLSTGPFDIPGIVRSVGATVGDNFVPLIIRGDLVGLGTVILLLLILKIVLDVGEKAAPIIGALA